MSSPRECSPSVFIGLAVGVLVVVNIIITAILLGRPVTTPQSCTPGVGNGADGQGTATQGGGAGTVINVQPGAGGSAVQTSSERIYLLAYGHEFGAYEYVDAGGYHRGFFRELADEVCTAAGVKCKAVFDKYQNCWISEPGKHPILGVGLQARYYDGWIGWQPTIERIHAASFSLPFTDSVPGHFYVQKGSTFDATDFTGKNIGFIQGYADNEKCLARQLEGKPGIPLKENQLKFGPDATTLYNMLTNGDVVAIFATKAAMGSYATNDSLKQLDPSLECVLGGLSIMSRADSEFPAIWNRGFQKIVTNGQFKKLCANGQEMHADKGPIDCIQSYDWNV